MMDFWRQVEEHEQQAWEAQQKADKEAYEKWLDSLEAQNGNIERTKQAVPCK